MGDDQSLCPKTLIPAACPSTCSCLVFSVFCTNISLEMIKYFNLYISIQMMHVSNVTLAHLSNALGKPVILVLKSSKPELACKHAESFRNLLKFDVAENIITFLKSHCFKSLKSIKHLNISLNRVTSISSFAFSVLNHLSTLDLSWNLMTELQGKIFSGLIKLKTLNLTGNRIISTSKFVFFNSYINSIETCDFQVCCFKPSIKTHCPLTPPWAKSCNRLVGNIVLRIFIWLFGSFGIVMNISAVLINLGQFLTIADNYKYVVLYLSFSDILFFFVDSDHCGGCYYIRL